jgi:hypothetical protein
VIKIFISRPRLLAAARVEPARDSFSVFPSAPLRRMLLGSIDIARLMNKVSINEQSLCCGFWLVIA